MKRSELLFNIVSIPVDIIALFLAALLSFYIRLQVTQRFPIIFIPDLHNYIKIIAAVIPVMLAIFGLYGLYSLKGTRKFPQELARIANAISMGLFLIVLIFFFDQNIFPSRLVILIGWIFAILFVAIFRFILKRVQVYFLGRGLGLHKLVILTGSQAEVSLVEEIKNNREHGYDVVAQMPNGEHVLAELERLYGGGNLEEILQADANVNSDLNLKLVEFARNKGLRYSFVPNLFEVQRNAIETESIEGIPVISLRNTPLDGWGKVYKRVFDIVVALVCLVLTSPLFLVLAILIKLDSPGKVLYAAPRGGRGKDFTFYKFRSMYSHLSVGEQYGGEEAEKMRHELWKVNARGGENGEFLKIKNDPRVTRMGRFLRKTKLDEIPQFINVLKGDMSMVGPRAHVIDEVERYRNRYRRMFTVKPGIFGLSQIAQLSWPDLPFEEEIKLNTYYIENWSIWLDLIVLMKSFYYLFLAPKAKEDY